jgi:hypothetical protein
MGEDQAMRGPAVPHIGPLVGDDGEVGTHGRER